MTTPNGDQSLQINASHRLTEIVPPRIDAGRVTDLRRKADRRVAELLVSRAASIRPEERALVLAVYRDGAGLADLARIAGCARKTARERLKRAVERMLSDRFDFVLRERERWSPLRRSVAQQCVLHGRSMRETARALGVSFHAVRRQLDAIDALRRAALAERAA